MVLGLKGTQNLVEEKACACRRMLDNVPAARTGLRDVVSKLLNGRVKHQLFRLIDPEDDPEPLAPPPLFSKDWGSRHGVLSGLVYLVLEQTQGFAQVRQALGQLGSIPSPALFFET